MTYTNEEFGEISKATITIPVVLVPSFYTPTNTPIIGKLQPKAIGSFETYVNDYLKSFDFAGFERPVFILEPQSYDQDWQDRAKKFLKDISKEIGSSFIFELGETSVVKVESVQTTELDSIIVAREHEDVLDSYELGNIDTEWDWHVKAGETLQDYNLIFERTVILQAVQNAEDSTVFEYKAIDKRTTVPFIKSNENSNINRNIKIGSNNVPAISSVNTFVNAEQKEIVSTLVIRRKADRDLCPNPYYSKAELYYFDEIIKVLEKQFKEPVKDGSNYALPEEFLERYLACRFGDDQVIHSFDRVKFLDHEFTNHIALTKDVFLAEGVTGIVGNPGSGKSLLVFMILDICNSEPDYDDANRSKISKYYPCGEPESGTYTLGQVLINRFLNFKDDERHLSIVDSLSELLKFKGKNSSTGLRGINTKALLDLSSASASCRSTGNSLFLTFNPYSLKEDVDLIFKQLQGSTSQAIACQGIFENDNGDGFVLSLKVSSRFGITREEKTIFLPISERCITSVKSQEQGSETRIRKGKHQSVKSTESDRVTLSDLYNYALLND